MAGDASKIPVWLTGDAYIFDPAIPFVAATHIPADIATPLNVNWLPLGLMKGDPGAEFTRDIDKTDVPSWQQGRVLTRYKNGKVDGTLNLLEENSTIELIVQKAKVPVPLKAYVAYVFQNENGALEKRFTKAKAHVWAATDHRQEDVNGREIQISYYPVGTDIFTILEGTPA
jgi:hypothetical protein